jgi:hypothetical protein
MLEEWGVLEELSADDRGAVLRVRRFGELGVLPDATAVPAYVPAGWTRSSRELPGLLDTRLVRAELARLRGAGGPRRATSG